MTLILCMPSNTTTGRQITGDIMKFSHSLQFNAVPEWSSKYIAYSHLKKVIYTLQKEKLYSSTPPNVSDEQQPLLDLQHGASNIYIQKFVEELNTQLSKIDKFFIQQESMLISNLNDLKDDIIEFDSSMYSNVPEDLLEEEVLLRRRRFKRRPNRRRNRSVSSTNDIASLESDDDDEEEDEDRDTVNSLSLQRNASVPVSNRNFSLGSSVPVLPNLDRKFNLKQRITIIFTQFSELKDFIQLNRTGFSKICKKFDKSLETNIKSFYTNSLSKNSYIFKPDTLTRVNDIIKQIIVMYAKFIQSIPQGITPTDQEYDYLDIDAAKRQLSAHLRDHLVWERNTVWKDMINLERKSHSLRNTGHDNQKHDTDDERGAGKYLYGDDATNGTDAKTQAENIFSEFNNFWKFISISAVFMLLLAVSPFSGDSAQKNCFAILVYASLLWATETLPLFVTALLIPLLVVIFPVLKDPGHNSRILTPMEASQFILSSMWSSVIMLLLGGFTLAAALSKYNIAKVISTHILSSVGRNPKVILLTNMSLALFISMWVSNVAAPMICFSIIQPILRTLPKKSTYAKSLILGIALASNIGGMASPISSPQNIFSISLMDPQPSWIEWFIIAVPVCALSILAIWILLVITFPLDPNLKILQLHTSNDPFTLTQWTVSFISLMTIMLWCLSNKMSGTFGDMGIISIVPILLFFGTGLLSSEDFNNFMWTIVILAMGGSTLGKAVSMSGLLATVAAVIKDKIANQPIVVIVFVFGIVILVMATFVSHVVAAMIILPLMKEIGAGLSSSTDHSRLLIMVATLLCSSAMGLPTSGIPNVTAISMIDELGDRYLTVGTFITRGVPSSIISYIIVVTVGYLLMHLIGY